MRGLIVNADDLGLSVGVNRGIVEAHLEGLVTSASLLVNGNAVEDALTRLGAQPVTLGLGLHLNLSLGPPVLPPSEVRSLVGPHGGFHPASAWLHATGQFEKEHIRAELEGQLQRFTQLAGRPPDHLDSHQFLACFHPDVFEVMLELADAWNVPVRSPGDFLEPRRLARFCEQVRAGNHGRGPRDEQVRHLPAALAEVRSRFPRVRWPDHFVRSFYGGAATAGTLRRILDELKPGVTELMCHPGYADGLDDEYRDEREAELTVLRHAFTRTGVDAAGVTLMTFAQVLS